jgi:N-acetylmuramoyl-L-alanine amidase
MVYKHGIASRFGFSPVTALVIFALALFSWAPPNFARAAEVQTAKVAYAGELTSSGDTTAISIKLDGKPDYRLFFMDNPVRLVLELEGAGFQASAFDALKPAGLVKSIRAGQVSAAKSRLVLSLSGPARVSAVTDEKVDASNRHVLKLDLVAASADEFAGAIAKQQELLGASGEVVVKGDRVRAAEKTEGRFTIVIDPGHGGIDGGSTGRVSKVLEKDITLQMARTLGELIEKSGPFDIEYTRTTDVFMSLKERQKFAHRQNADLLISIHADTLRQTDVRGATIYTLARRASDALAQEIADSENLADVVAGLAAPEAQDVVADILVDLTLRETTHFSREFSNQLVQRLQHRINLINNPQRSAAFVILKNAETPGVLLELGYLSNAEDEKLLTDPDWQKKVADAVADAVKSFFSRRQPHVKAN